jgi:hypothetical protein
MELTNELIDQFAEDWVPDGPVEWDDYLNRFERYHDIDLPEDMTDPVIRRIQRRSRAVWRELKS